MRRVYGDMLSRDNDNSILKNALGDDDITMYGVSNTNQTTMIDCRRDYDEEGELVFDTDFDEPEDMEITSLEGESDMNRWASNIRLLFRYVIDGDEAKLTELLEKSRLHPDSEDSVGHTAFLVASRYGRLDIMKRLLAEGSNPAHRTKAGNSAWMLAAAAGHLDVLQYLMIEIGTTLSPREFESVMVNYNKDTILMFAAMAGQLQVLEYLLNLGRASDVMTSLPANGSTRMHPLSIFNLNADGVNVVICACDSGNYDTVEMLVNAVKEAFGEYDDEEEFLKQITLDENLYEKTKSALQNIGGYNVPRRGRRPNMPLDPEDSETAVYLNHCDINGNTALHASCKFRNNGSIAELLLKYGANPSLRNNIGKTAEDMWDNPEDHVGYLMAGYRLRKQQSADNALMELLGEFDSKKGKKNKKDKNKGKNAGKQQQTQTQTQAQTMQAISEETSSVGTNTQHIDGSDVTVPVTSDVSKQQQDQQEQQEQQDTVTLDTTTTVAEPQVQVEVENAKTCTTDPEVIPEALAEETTPEAPSVADVDTSGKEEKQTQTVLTPTAFSSSSSSSTLVQDSVSTLKKPEVSFADMASKKPTVKPEPVKAAAAVTTKKSSKDEDKKSKQSSLAKPTTGSSTSNSTINTDAAGAISTPPGLNYAAALAKAVHRPPPQPPSHPGSAPSVNTNNGKPTKTEKGKKNTKTKGDKSSANTYTTNAINAANAAAVGMGTTTPGLATVAPLVSPILSPREAHEIAVNSWKQALEQREKNETSGPKEVVANTKPTAYIPVGASAPTPGVITRQLYKLDDRAEPLAITPLHILGSDLNSLSTEQLNCIEDILDMLSHNVRKMKEKNIRKTTQLLNEQLVDANTWILSLTQQVEKLQQQLQQQTQTSKNKK